MAFLDNSGDIILDAVLTDVGRKRMARGNFQVTKFALGDDEIDYGLYDKNHPSGSAYYDLEVLQTPILEAFTQANASLNYGLITYTRNDLLYLPTIVLNTKNSAAGMSNVVIKDPTRNVIYLAKSNKTDSSSPANTTSDMLNADLGNLNSVLVSNSNTTNFIFIETGLDTTQLKSTSQNQNTYLMGVGLNDQTFNVSFDGRWITTIYGPGQGSYFQMGAAGAPEIGWSVSSHTAGASAPGMSNYREVSTNGYTSKLYPPSTGDDLTANYSNISGPRGAFTILNFAINDNIAHEDFSKHGSTARTLVAGSSHTYDYIDTIVYVRGLSTNIVLQIPIRIIQAAQTS